MDDTKASAAPAPEAGADLPLAPMPALDSAEAALPREKELEQQLAEAKDQYLRVLADTENFKKRVARERLDERAYAAGEVVLAVLPLLDNLERSLQAAASQGVSASAEGPLGQLMKGVELTVKQFEDSLRKQGVLPVACEIGKPFDANQHQALFQEPHPEMDEGLVLEVLQRGWQMGERLLRPALVNVSARP